jgi:hypothetical protein
MNMTETTLMLAIRNTLNQREDVRVFRNNCGFDRERKVKYGLVNGSADLIGWRTLTITQEMVGTQVAQFVSVEVKTSKGRTSSEQENWKEQVTKHGGLAIVARELADLRWI